MSLSLCHSAALAFVGWILIEPPLVWVHGSAQLFVKAPSSNWIRPDGDEAQEFSSEMECEDYLAKQLAALRDLQHTYPDYFSRPQDQQEANMVCIRFDNWLKTQKH